MDSGGNMPLFLPAKQVGSAFAVAAMTGVFLTLTRMYVRRLISMAIKTNNKDSLKDEKKRLRLIDRRSLQATYLVANGLFALAGIVTLIPLLQAGTWQSTMTPLSRASGHVSLGVFGSTQTGYSVWSIWMDPDRGQLCSDHKLMLNEETLMLIHHIIIVGVGMILSTSYLGFRVYSPFFCGISEVSSILLVIMKALARGRQKGYRSSRLAFAVSFLSVRVIGWLVFMRLFLRDLMQLLLSSKGIIMSSAMMLPLSATFPLLVLTLLQLNWAFVIGVQLMKMVGNKKGD